MTGPEHYREAEELLTQASRNFLRGDDTTSAVAAAQVHATLALAAATAHGTVPTTGIDRAAWREAIGTPDGELEVTSSVW
ncbi:hypothetical protein [Streptomyces sp. BE133]|uniref:hypothetical protein n=1 Tax=Streptomyces sp. BE133 TaxID=3002523 RepID=UPI002E77DD89|nr:hypothetical protein [Streptomyces sp. BE133]MEE1812642.1 hypothetical protein [Streptomyces sp. BE133]